MYEMCLGSGQRADADVHPCTFECEVIRAPSRLPFEHAFYPMTIVTYFAYNCIDERNPTE